MAAPIFTTIFEPANANHKPFAAWRGRINTRANALGNAKQWCRIFGEAKILRADGSVLRYWMDEGTLRQRTYRNVIVAH
jgi:hypothetical protein